MNQSIRDEQKQTLSEQMQQAMQLLQMNAQELEAYMRELALENPMLEISPPKERPERPLDFADAGFFGRKFKTFASEELDGMRHMRKAETLLDSLLEQIAAAHIPELMRRELKWLAGELDERGYLPEEPQDFIPFSGSRLRYNNALRVFQSFEPAGVGARNLSECLCIQLRRQGIQDEIPYIICKNYLERLARGQLNYIAAQTGASMRQVSNARRLIASLEPKPSNGFAGEDIVPYIQPDIEVVLDGEKLIAVPADRYAPCYAIDPHYFDMSQKEDLTAEEREYFRAKISQAKWAVSCVERRRDMLLSCTKIIIDVQNAFLKDGKSRLLPLTMTEMAERLEVYPSTVSRAVRGKYLSCHWGVFPLSHFFAQAVSGGEDITAGAVTSTIKELIAAEDSAHPLSDRGIAEKLAFCGMNVSRRTVAKYRDAANIPPASARRAR